MTAELALPTSVRPETWNADTAAMMEFAGLTWVEQRPDPENPGTPRSVRLYAPPGITAAFIAACVRTGLDPTAKQIYAAIIGGKWVILVGIDGFRVVAQRTGEYDGQDPIEWQAEENGPWTTVPPKMPHAARVRIYRKGMSRPLEQTVTFAEFGGTGNNWTKRPSHMLGIRAESHGFRRAYPMQLAGLYTPEDFQDEATDTSDAEQAPSESEDWGALIAAADSPDTLAEVGARLAESGEGTEKLRAAYRARSAALLAEANTVDAEEVTDVATEEPIENTGTVIADAEDRRTRAEYDAEQAAYEAAAAVEFDAAVEAGEVSP